MAATAGLRLKQKPPFLILVDLALCECCVGLPLLVLGAVVGLPLAGDQRLQLCKQSTKGSKLRFDVLHELDEVRFGLGVVRRKLRIHVLLACSIIRFKLDIIG